MLQRYLLLWLVLLSAVAFRWDRWASFDPFVASKPYWSHLFAVTMFAVGWLLPADELRQLRRRWPMVLAGTALQYTAMPLLGYGLGRLFGLDRAAFVGIVIAGCVPGAMASNVLTLMARGHVSYSVSLTAASTLLSPLAVPLGLGLALGTTVQLDPFAVSRSLCWTVVLPVLAGCLLSRWLTSWQVVATQVVAARVAPAVANLTILWIVAAVVADSRAALADVRAVVVLALLALNLGGYAAGYLGGAALRLPETMRRALTLEIGMQSAGLGSLLAVKHFGPAEAAPTVLYMFGCMLTGTLLARAWATRATPVADDGGPLV